MDKLFVVYLQDTNGSCRIIGDLDLTYDQAKDRIDKILQKQNKSHKVDYFMAEYTLDTKQQVLKELGINR